MDIAKIDDSPIGRLVAIKGTDPRTQRDYDHFAFVPEDLPEVLILDQKTWTCVASATGALGQLRQVTAQLPNPSLLITPALAKEALTTSALEGTYGALGDVLEARLPGFEPRSPEIREIHAYESMAHLAFGWIEDREITIGMLCDLQKILAEASRRPVADPGSIRTEQVVIGPEDASVYEARFVPSPPGDQLRAGFEAWQEWVKSNHDLPVVVLAALAHYQFETLHPFSDCNGRVGRLVIVLQLMRDGALEAPSLTISPWLLRRRNDYQDQLLELSRTGNWDPWVQFVARAIQEQSESHVLVAKQLLDWMNETLHKLHQRRWTGTILNLAEQLIDWPIVSNSWVRSREGVTAPTAQSAIDRLVAVGVLTELTGRSYGRVYGATEVMQLVESL